MLGCVKGGRCSRTVQVFVVWLRLECDDDVSSRPAKLALLLRQQGSLVV